MKRFPGVSRVARIVQCLQPRTSDINAQDCIGAAILDLTGMSLSLQQGISMQRRSMRATVIFSILVVMILGLAAFSFPYAPLEDLPEWIYQGYIFNELVSGTPSADFALKNFPVPYALFQTIASACLLFASPMAASRIVVFLYAGLSLYAINLVIARYRLDPYVAWPLLISAV